MHLARSQILSLLADALTILPDKSEETPENTLRALWLTAAGTPTSPIRAEGMPLPALSETQAAWLNEAVERRLSGVPLAHLTCRQDFMGLEFTLTEGSFIPRKETELLAGTCLETLREAFPDRETQVLDLCTGIGAVALAVAHHVPGAVVHGTDILEPAIQLARRNARDFGLEDRSSFHHADLFGPFLGREAFLDVVVTTPPYISSAKVPAMAREIADFEPREAFDAGPFGLSIFSRLVAESPNHLKPGGFLLIECGLNQGKFLARKLGDSPDFADIEGICDAQGNVRVLKARRV